MKTSVSAAAALLALTLLTAGCSDDNEPSTSEPAGSESPAGEDTDTPDQETAGDGADESLDPVRIGWVNTDSGTPAFPGATHGAEAAVAYINAELGGVGGHPVELVICSADATPESTQACGQEFANDADIDFAASGLMLQGAGYFDAMSSAGKPTIGGTPVTPADYAAPGVTFLFGGGPVNNVVRVRAVDEVLHAATAAVLYDDGPAGLPGLQFTEGELDQTDIKYVSVGVDPAASDPLAQVTQALAGSPDAVLLINTTQTCLAVAQALQTLAYDGDIITTQACYNATSQESFDFSDWHVVDYAQSLEIEAGTDVDVDTYLENYGDYADTEPGESFASVSWGQLLTIHELLEGIGVEQITPESVLAAVSAFQGPVILGADQFSCPGPADYPAICSTVGQVYRVIENGSVESETPEGIDIRQS